jgi:hypothetical protein
MIPDPGRSSDKEQFQYDDSIFESAMQRRIALPNDEITDFSEEQRFDQIWLWTIMGIQLLIIMVPLALTGQSWWTMVITFLAMILSMVLLGSLKLNTWMDAEGVHYKMKLFHWRVRTILWDEIDQIQVRKYAPVKEYGGWGVRYGQSGRAYNVRGNYGIQIIKKDGKRVLIGTQKPEEAADYLSAKQLLV